jgi:hypothetical protein
MNNLLKYTGTILLTLILSNSANAQHYDNFYSAVNADMLEISGNSFIEHTLKGATIIFPNGSNQLNVLVQIPYNTLYKQPVVNSGISFPNLLFSLKVNINPVQIQEELTSTKSFSTSGLLCLNNFSKSVAVKYMPIPSGTEENGNFNVYMVIQFNPADFNIGLTNGNTKCIIKINDAKVNRV